MGAANLSLGQKKNLSELDSASLFAPTTKQGQMM